ncbi:hypothetical protein BJY04DRAFT_220334 [Aspergillus karnatakaensis]|uniref:uncharacterized protein n=1 Tax=Aspergillus karnatakaensis TaxID=1810916 RepID=UPI003CCE42C4
MHLFKAASVLLTLATAIYAQASSSKYDFDLTLSEYEDRAASLASTHRVSNIHGYVSGGKTLYTATWEPIPADAIDRIVYVGLTKDEWYYHSSWNISGYHVLVQNIFANEATEDRYNIICEKMPNSGPKRRYTTQPVTLAKLKEHLNEWAAQKSDPPTRPLAINSWTSGSSPWFNLIYGPDVESPDDYWQNIFATEIRYAQSADSFQEMIVSSAIRGMSPVTLSVAPWYDGVPLFSSLWRKTAEVNSYPQWSVYREIDRHTMEERLSAAVAKGGIVRDLVAYHKGDALNFAAIIDNLPPAVRETYLPGQPLVDHDYQDDDYHHYHDQGHYYHSQDHNQAYNDDNFHNHNHQDYYN